MHLFPSRAACTSNFGDLTLASMKYNPIVAAVLHVAGSLIVVFNSFRLVRSGEELEPHQAPTPEPPHEHKHDAVRCSRLRSSRGRCEGLN